jgi:hypothetical protein
MKLLRYLYIVKILVAIAPSAVNDYLYTVKKD